MNITHNDYKSPEHVAWMLMKSRCNCVNNKDYDNYGGRGIRVCDRWNDYENFLADMKRKPSPEHTLDRKDNNGNYEKDNCKWSTRNEQARNRSSNIVLEYKGKSQTLVEWSEELGIEYTTLHNRHRYGWSTERILEDREISIEYMGRLQSMKEWAIELGISYDSIRARRLRGYSVERILAQYQITNPEDLSEVIYEQVV